MALSLSTPLLQQQKSPDKKILACVSVRVPLQAKDSPENIRDWIIIYNIDDTPFYIHKCQLPNGKNEYRCPYFVECRGKYPNIGLLEAHIRNQHLPPAKTISSVPTVQLATPLM